MNEAELEERTHVILSRLLKVDYARDPQKFWATIKSALKEAYDRGYEKAISERNE